MINHMAAILIFKDKYIYNDGAIREMIIWRLPQLETKRPHGLKYRLYYGHDGKCLVRYDNEKGKGDHRHYGKREEYYHFISAEKLIADFKADIVRLRGNSNEK